MNPNSYIVRNHIYVGPALSVILFLDFFIFLFFTIDIRASRELKIIKSFEV